MGEFSKLQTGLGVIEIGAAIERIECEGCVNKTEGKDFLSPGLGRGWVRAFRQRKIHEGDRFHYVSLLDRFQLLMFVFF